MKKTIFLFIIICLTTLQVNAQKSTISGVINDETGFGVPGASIVVEGSTIGTITNNTGNFSLQVNQPVKAIIVSYIGYETQRIAITGQKSLVINLKPSAIGLQEVVAVGYGTQKKVSVVGAISNVKADELSKISSSNLSNSLGGRVSGIIVKLQDGTPGGDDPQINIRGLGTINDASPLVLIDGMEGNLGRINPNDIESFSVLKDASATAVYGVRGANGVILITTKRGVIGKPTITINGQYRLQKIINYPTFLGSYDYARLYNEALNNAGLPLLYNNEDLEHYRTGDSPYTHPDVDWFDAFVKPYSPEQRYDVNLRGGTDKVKYFIAGEYVTQQGAYRQFADMENSTNAAYNRFNLRMNFDFALSKTTDINLNMNGRIQDKYAPNSGDNTSAVGGAENRPGNFWDDIVWHAPNMTPLYNPDGSIGASSIADNGAYSQLRAGGYTNEKDNNLKASIQINQKLDFITKGLSFRAMAGINSTMQYNFKLSKAPATYIYNPDGTYTRSQSPVLPGYSVDNETILNNDYIESAISYNRSFGDHAFTGLALYNQDKVANNANAWNAHRGFAGRATYAYNNKYLAEVNVGYNGSTQFVSQNRYTLLPAYSLGWVVSEESFFKELLPQVTFLKLRGSYGTVGNDKIGNNQFLYLAVYDPIAQSYRFGEALTIYKGLREASLANENVSWEIAKKQNYGFDLEFKNGLFGLGFDYFNEDRSNILAKRKTITQVLGLSTNQLPAENFGKVQNQGFEIEARFNKKFGDFKVSANGSFSRAENKIIDIDEVKYDLDYKNQTGKQIGQYFGYTWTGDFYTFEELGYVWDESVTSANKYVLPVGALPTVPVPTVPVKPGDLKFVDRNNDGIIDDYDSGAIGKSSKPLFIYGLNTTFSYKGFSFNMFWQGAGGFNARFNGQYSQEFLNKAKVNDRHLGRWAFYEDPLTGELIDTRATATYPRLIVAGSTETQRSSTFNLFSGDYLRLKTAELSYDLPKSVLKPIKMNNVTIFLTGTNLLTFSKVKYIDPENPAAPSAYPQSSVYGAGLKIGL